MRVGFEPTIAAIEQSRSGFSTFAFVVEAVKVDSVTAPLALGAQSQAQIQVQAPAPAPASIAAVATRTPETPALAVVAATARLPASKLEISNGNGVSGMAARVGKWLATQGMSTNRLTNQQKFAQQQTVVQYRRGHEEAALWVARSLPATAKAEAAPTEGLRSDVRVVIGRDWIQTAACLDRNTCQPLATSVAGLTPR